MEQNEVEVLTFQQLEYLTECTKANTIIIQLEHLLDCDRKLILEKVKDIQKGGLATTQEIKDISHWLENVTQNVSDAQYDAEEASMRATNAEEYCSTAHGYLDDIGNKVSNWMSVIKKQEEKEAEVCFNEKENTQEG